MGKITGFMEWPRHLPMARPADERTRDFAEFVAPFDDEEARRQGGRCMDCGIPFCQQGCPLGNPIPDFNHLVYKGRWRDAYQRLISTNNFPEFTGRLCPAPCEPACTLAIDEAPVTIEAIEKEIIERAFANGWVEPALPSVAPSVATGRKIAIVGSGPAGLAAAAQLSSIGHQVTVFEADDRIGGLLRYGIPDFKMERSVLDRRLALLERQGVRFVTGARVGQTPTWSELRASHHALLIAIGSRRARELEVPGRDLAGVHLAMDFLTRQNRLIAGDAPPDEGMDRDRDRDMDRDLDARGKRVIILGGGDTGSDCLGTSLRQGAAQVTQIELLQAPPHDRAPGNPWPQWPLIFRTSTSQSEGGERDFGLLTTRLEGQDGRLVALHAVRVNVQRGPDGPHFQEVPGTETRIPCDMLLLAMGFVGPDAGPLIAELGVELDARGNVATDAHHATSVTGVFCAGDARRGQSLVVWAISEGREAARAMDMYLRESSAPRLPTRGLDQHFGGRR